jgi:predicted porin
MPPCLFFTTLLFLTHFLGGNMNKKLIALAVSAGLALPGFANAVEVAGKALDIYGKAHISVDSVSAKDTTGGSVSNLSMSSNSSRLGFKGEGDIGSMTGFYKIEGDITFDNGDTSRLSHRAAYAGMKGTGGSLLLGYRDTPFKDVRGKFDLFGDTVGDARDIVGSYGGTNYTDQRAKNALMYTTPKMGGVQINAMYSTAWQSDTSAQQGQDNNNNSLTAVNLLYASNGLGIAAGVVEQNYVDGTTGDKTTKDTGTRLVVTYGMGSMRFGVMYDQVKIDTNKRTAYGLNFKIKAGGGDVKVQYVKAGDLDGTTATGANQVSIGYGAKLAKNSSYYVMYSKISNDDNVAYLMGNGHDQKYTTATGKDLSAFSVGYTYSF